MSALVLKVKTKIGQVVVKDLTSDHLVSDLKSQLSRLCQIPEGAIHVLSGFPPKPLELNDSTQTLAAVGIKTGDTLIVEEKQPNVPKEDVPKEDVPNKPTDDFQHSIYEDQLNCPGILMRKVVPADNSCLFTSVGFTLSGKVDTTCGGYMRQLIAEHVTHDRDTYSEAILGRPNDDYCNWILKSDSWGGAIELSVLSRYYGIEICVVDTSNAIINRFGEDQNYAQRVFLIFDGIHYDPLYLEPMEGGDNQTLFPITDERVLQEAEQLAREAKSSRQFTDVNRFSLKCLDCQIVMQGQVQAQEHAKETGHTNFGEV